MLGSVLAGAALGALTNDEDRLKGALLGGVLGGASGVLSAGTKAATEKGANALINKAGQNKLQEGVQTELVKEQLAKEAAKEAIQPGVAGTVQHGPKSPSFYEQVKNNFSDNITSKDKLKTTGRAINSLGERQARREQEMAAMTPPPVSMESTFQPLQSRQDRVASGEPTFVPKALFDSELKGANEAQQREKLMRMLRERGVRV